MYKTKSVKLFLSALLVWVSCPIYANAFIPKNNIITTAEIANMTNLEIWNNMVNPVVMVSNSKVPQATNPFGAKKLKFPLITHQDILNYLVSLPPVSGYTQTTGLTLFVNPSNTQISSQVTQVLKEMNNAFVFNSSATNSLAASDISALFPIVSSSANNASSGMFNAANESAIPTLIFGHSVAFRDVVNKIQLQGNKNLSQATLAQDAVGLSVYAAKFAFGGNGAGATAGSAGLLGNGQAGKGALSIADAQEQQIKQMLNAPSLDVPTACSCITEYCVCLAGRRNMLLGYIDQTKVQRQQKINLDKHLVDLTGTIVDAIKERGIKVVSSTEQIEKLKSQQTKDVFDKEEELSYWALTKKFIKKTYKRAKAYGKKVAKKASQDQVGEDVLSEVKNKEKATTEADEAVSKRTADEVSKSVSSNSVQSSEDIVKDRRDMLIVHQKDFCSSEDRRNHYCYVENLPQSQNADIRAGNLFDKSYSVEQEHGATVYIDYIINNKGLKVNAIPYKLIENDDVAKQLRARSMQLSALRSLPLLAMTEVKNDRVPVKGLGYLLNQYVLFDMLDDESVLIGLNARIGLEDKDLSDYLNDILSSSSSFQVKNMELMAFKNEMTVRNYILKEKIMAMAAALNSLDLSGANKGLQKSISDL